MKVLVLATRDWYHPAAGGGDITMWENARYLASTGHDVTFLAAGFAGAAKEETVDGIHLVRLGIIHTLWVRTLVYYMTRGRGRFDVAIVEGFGGARIPRFTPLYIKEPILTEWHQVHRDLFAAQYPRIMGWPLNLLERTAAWVHRNTLVRAGTDEIKDTFVQLGFKPNKVFVIPVSVREEWLSAHVSGPSSEPHILWLGKIRRYKAPDHVLRAMPAVLGRLPDARLTIAGRHDDLQYEREMQQLAKDLGIEAHVRFQFNLTEEQKLDLVRNSRVMVVPSAVEGFGIVVLEANAVGVPVVASSGVPQGAVRHGMNGLRYPYADIPGLAASICKMLEDDELYAQLSDAGRVFARRFAWRKVGAQYAEIVERAATKS